MPNFRRFVPVVVPEFDEDLTQDGTPVLRTLPSRTPRRRFKGRRNVEIQDDNSDEHAFLGNEQYAVEERTIPIKPPKSPSLPTLERSGTPKRGAVLLQQETATFKHSKMKSPAYVLQCSANELTEHERTEILDFSSVYYWGQKAVKNYNSRSYNNGYDDQRGDYLGVIGDHIAYHYELIAVLGQGSFGKVFKAIDHATQQMVALKIVKNKKKFHREGIIEVRLLETLKKADAQDISCTLKLINSLYFRQHLIIVTEMLGMNLYDMILQNNMAGISSRELKLFAAECINALYFAEKLRIIHADIKPENILVTAPKSSKVKVIDWGSGCFVNETVYEYIQSRFYRAPEVILGLPYSEPIDIWSLGCVFAELLSGQPLFGGEDELDELKRIIEVLGMPPPEMIQKAPRKKEFFSDQGELLAPCQPASLPLWREIKDANLLALCRKMLVWSPVKRATASSLLQDAWVIEGFRDAQIEVAEPVQRDIDTADLSSRNSGAEEEEREATPKHDAVDELGFKIVMKTGSVRLPKIGDE